jgi:lipid II isoglutaminyl synthase (glutamine-hydrolysing)
MADSSATHAPTLRVGHLYRDQLNLYGDHGNVLTWRYRCARRDIALEVIPLDIGEPLDPRAYDLLFIGGGQDREQAEVASDLLNIKAQGLWLAVESDMPVLAVCGGYQLLARSYRPAGCPVLEGLGIFPAWTIHPGHATARCVGNIALSWAGSTLVGFENHGGRTYLEPGARALGRILKGHGNNGEDQTEGSVYRQAYGTYLHGPLLPKNPHFADHLLTLALQRKYGANASCSQLLPLDDSLEWQAHDAMLRRLGVAPQRPRILPA